MLSAVEGIEVSAPDLQTFVVPISCAIIIVLFAVQSRGTGSVGRIFGPVMAVWFLVLAVLGTIQIVGHPSVLRALSPHYIGLFCYHHGWLAFVALGSVVLAVTGAESAVCRYGAFRRAAYPPGLDVFRAAIAGR